MTLTELRDELKTMEVAIYIEAESTAWEEGSRDGKLALLDHVLDRLNFMIENEK